jgi:hypothetical protein
MQTTQTAYTQAVEDLSVLFKERKAKALELNTESEALAKKFEKEAKVHEETLLFSVSFDEIVVTFGKQQMDNLFPHCEYPAGGLFLREVRFVHIEEVDSNELKYLTSVRVQFLFNEKSFNHDVLLHCLAFDDQYLRVSEQVVGLGTNPRFASKEKYEEVRDVLIEISKKIFEELKK